MNAVKTMMISMGASAAVFSTVALIRKIEERRDSKKLKDLQEKLDEDTENLQDELLEMTKRYENHISETCEGLETKLMKDIRDKLEQMPKDGRDIIGDYAYDMVKRINEEA